MPSRPSKPQFRPARPTRKGDDRTEGRKWDHRNESPRSGGRKWEDRPAQGKSGRSQWDERPAQGRNSRSQWEERPAQGRNSRSQWEDRPARPRPAQNEWEDRPARARPAQNRWEDRPAKPYPPRDRREERPAPRGYQSFEYTPAPEQPPVAEQPAVPAENLLVGRNPIREALRSGRDLEKLLVMRGELSGSARQLVQMAREQRIPVQEVEKSRLDELAPNHQGMIAFASAYAYATVGEILERSEALGEDPFVVVLDGITDPQNLGAIIRTAACAGAHGVIVRERRGVGLTPAAVKASAGAVEHVPVARVTNLNRTLADLKQRGIWVYALTMDGEDYETVDFRGGVALVVGSEGSGLSRLTEEECDKRVSLPLHGDMNSLNASVAAGIAMYRVLSARRA